MGLNEIYCKSIEDDEKFYINVTEFQNSLLFYITFLCSYFFLYLILDYVRYYKVYNNRLKMN